MECPFCRSQYTKEKIVTCWYETYGAYSQHVPFHYFLSLVKFKRASQGKMLLDRQLIFFYYYINLCNNL